MQRIRRAKKSRNIIRIQEIPRLTVNRTNNHIYAQIISACGSKVLASTSTLDNNIIDNKKGNNIENSSKIGKTIAEKSISAGIEKVAFDRSGFRYHGRIKALAEAAREKGLKF